MNLVGAVGRLSTKDFLLFAKCRRDYKRYMYKYDDLLLEYNSPNEIWRFDASYIYDIAYNRNSDTILNEKERKDILQRYVIEYVSTHEGTYVDGMRRFVNHADDSFGYASVYMHILSRLEFGIKGYRPQGIDIFKGSSLWYMRPNNNDERLYILDMSSLCNEEDDTEAAFRHSLSIPDVYQLFVRVGDVVRSLHFIDLSLGVLVFSNNYYTDRIRVATELDWKLYRRKKLLS